MLATARSEHFLSSSVTAGFLNFHEAALQPVHHVFFIYLGVRDYKFDSYAYCIPPTPSQGPTCTPADASTMIIDDAAVLERRTNSP